MSLFDSNVDVLSTALNMYLLRHAIISDNIANAETPGYKARRVEFEQELNRVLENQKIGLNQTISGRAIASVRPTVYEDPKSEVGLDRNSVDMDREMAALTKNDIKYSATSLAISKKFALLQYAISAGAER